MKMKKPYKQISAEDIASAADFCYNGTNDKPLPLGEVAA